MKRILSVLAMTVILVGAGLTVRAESAAPAAKAEKAPAAKAEKAPEAKAEKAEATPKKMKHHGKKKSKDSSAPATK